jgi:hypothetical protein
VKATELKALLEAFYREKLALKLRRAAAARLISSYEVNNTYQYVINRDEVQLAWLRNAIAEIAGELGDSQVTEPQLQPPSVKGTEGERSVIAEDRDLSRQFIDRWSDRVESVTNNRQRGMLRVILGETREQERFFNLALAGRQDLLGRRPDGMGTGGGVLPTRWME